MATWGPLTYESERFGELVHALDRVVAKPDTLLLLGEPGSGKTAIAQAVHGLGGRPGRFVAVDCPTVTETLFESELFGYEKGAFTGAVARKPGRFEEAEHGTLFLDEVGEVPLALQPKLLRAVGDKVIRRVGGTTDTTVDVRLIAATNRDLAGGAADGTFRGDLLSRLAPLHFVVPPLREREADIGPLAQAFYRDDADVRAPTSRLTPELPESAIRELRAYSWPGNVRDLRSVVRRVVLFCGESGAITARDVRTQIEAIDALHRPRSQGAVVPVGKIDLDAEMEQEMRRRVVAALGQSGGNIARAAELLTKKKQTLHKYIQSRGGLQAFGFGDTRQA